MVKKAEKSKRDIESYAHADKDRANNPPVGLVTPGTDPEAGTRSYSHDPHLDPCLSWADKTEHTSFEVPTVSLHVHERIDPRTIIEAVRKSQRRRRACHRAACGSLPEENPRRYEMPSSSTSTATTGPTA